MVRVLATGLGEADRDILTVYPAREPVFDVAVHVAGGYTPRDIAAHARAILEWLAPQIGRQGQPLLIG